MFRSIEKKEGKKRKKKRGLSDSFLLLIERTIQGAGENGAGGSSGGTANGKGGKRGGPVPSTPRFIPSCPMTLKKREREWWEPVLNL